ncbi:hypothetical protein SDC9_72459 [bioreactor metagenome]|uniref:Uncharacterized protein n=1 Tax=bioreactor metagenome TaxID=1076179 RepID=A0A644YDD4_9ZZZZ
MNEDSRRQHDHEEAYASFKSFFHHLGDIRSFLDDLGAVAVGNPHEEEEEEEDAGDA